MNDYKWDRKQTVLTINETDLDGLFYKISALEKGK